MTAPTFTRNGSPFTPIDTTILKLVRGGTLPAVGTLLRNGSSFSMIDTRPLRWHQGSGGGGGGSPKLYSYDFIANPTLPATFALTRPGTGWYFNSSGIITAASTNVARFDNDYNGSAWVQGGLLVEAASTNLIGYSDSFRFQDGFNTSVPVGTSGSVNNPFGNLSQQITEITSNTNQGVLWQMPGSQTDFNLSVLAKETGAGSKRYLSLGPGSFHAFGIFDVATGAVTETGGAHNTLARSKNYNGWRRFEAATNVNFTGDFVWIGLANTPTPADEAYGRESYIGDGVSGMFWSGYQVEAQGWASSPIPTSANTPVTRPADALTSAGTLSTQLAAGPSVWELEDLATRTITRTSFAAGAFTFPVGKRYRSMAVYPAGTDTTPYLTVGGAY